MRFAFVIPARISNGGGAERWCEAVASSLSALGHTVDLYAPTDTSLPLYAGSAFSREIDFQSRLHWLMKRFRVLGFYPPLMFVRIPQAYDAVYSASMFPILTFARLESPLIVGTHDAFTSNQSVSADSLQAIPRWLYRLIRRSRKTLVHSLNSLTTQKFMATGWPLEEVPIFSLSPSFDPIQHGSFRIVFIGPLDRRKGAGLLRQVVAGLSEWPDVTFTAIGKTSPNSKRTLTSLLESRQFEHVGFVPDEAKAKILSTASLCLHLSTRETSPAVPLEALRAGVPVVSTWAPIERVVTSPELTSVAADRIRVIDAIRQVYLKWKSDPKAFLRMRERLREDALREYDPSENLGRTVALITHFAGSSG